MFHLIFFRALGIKLPPKGTYATGIVYFEEKTMSSCIRHFNKLAEECRLKVLSWRELPVDNSQIGSIAKETEPKMKQVFVVGPGLDEETFKRQVKFLGFTYQGSEFSHFDKKISLKYLGLHSAQSGHAFYSE